MTVLGPASAVESKAIRCEHFTKSCLKSRDHTPGPAYNPGCAWCSGWKEKK